MFTTSMFIHPLAKLLRDQVPREAYDKFMADEPANIQQKLFTLKPYYLHFDFNTWMRLLKKYNFSTAVTSNAQLLHAVRIDVIKQCLQSNANGLLDALYLVKSHYPTNNDMIYAFQTLQFAVGNSRREDTRNNYHPRPEIPTEKYSQLPMMFIIQQPELLACLTTEMLGNIQKKDLYTLDDFNTTRFNVSPVIEALSKACAQQIMRGNIAASVLPQENLRSYRCQNLDYLISPQYTVFTTQQEAETYLAAYLAKTGFAKLIGKTPHSAKSADKTQKAKILACCERFPLLIPQLAKTDLIPSLYPAATAMIVHLPQVTHYMLKLIQQGTEIGIPRHHPVYNIQQLNLVDESHAKEFDEKYERNISEDFMWYMAHMMNLAKHNIELQFRAGKLFLARGYTALALEYLQKAATDSNSPHALALQTLGDYYFALGNAAAFDYYAKAINSARHNILPNSGSFQLAATTYERLAEYNILNALHRLEQLRSAQVTVIPANATASEAMQNTLLTQQFTHAKHLLQQVPEKSQHYAAANACLYYLLIHFKELAIAGGATESSIDAELRNYASKVNEVTTRDFSLIPNNIVDIVEAHLKFPREQEEKQAADGVTVEASQTITIPTRTITVRTVATQVTAEMLSQHSKLLHDSTSSHAAHDAGGDDDVLPLDYDYEDEAKGKVRAQSQYN